MTAYYNENDPFAAAWLRELIKANLIASGDVDERSIEDIKPSELKDYTQCHFFAGIGVWSYALRQAGWSDDREVWTGSCPCQPFSAAGKRDGTSDERHLWPAWYHLAEKCRPSVIFGEQVASKDGLAWLDLVSSDLEAADYTVGAIDTCSAGVGAPHIRQRLYFVAESQNHGFSRKQTARNRRPSTPYNGSISRLANTKRNQEHEKQQGSETYERERSSDGPSRRSLVGRLAQPNGWDSSSEGLQRSRIDGQQSKDGRIVRSATCGFWREADWIPCIDGKARPVEPGTFPLATGIANRVGLLRGYGNSLTAPVAQAFIESYLEVFGN